MGHIFISYSHKDKEYVDKLAKALEKEGFQIWVDDQIHYGSEWPKAVEKNLDVSDGVILVMSKNSYESDMVQNEVTRAREKKKTIFPLLLNGDNWLIVQTKQFVDVSDASLPSEKFFKRLEKITPRKNMQSHVKNEKINQGVDNSDKNSMNKIRLEDKTWLMQNYPSARLIQNRATKRLSWKWSIPTAKGDMKIEYVYLGTSDNDLRDAILVIKIVDREISNVNIELNTFRFNQIKTAVTKAKEWSN